MQNTCRGTPIKYQAVVSSDSIRKNGGLETRIITHVHCITAMKEYRANSFEELRAEDYVIGRKSSKNENKTSFTFGNPFTNSDTSTHGTQSGMSAGSIFGRGFQKALEKNTNRNFSDIFQTQAKPKVAFGMSPTQSVHLVFPDKPSTATIQQSAFPAMPSLFSHPSTPIPTTSFGKSNLQVGTFLHNTAATNPFLYKTQDSTDSPQTINTRCVTRKALKHFNNKRRRGLGGKRLNDVYSTNLFAGAVSHAQFANNLPPKSSDSAVKPSFPQSFLTSSNTLEVIAPTTPFATAFAPSFVNFGQTNGIEQYEKRNDKQERAGTCTAEHQKPERKLGELEAIVQRGFIEIQKAIDGMSSKNNTSSKTSSSNTTSFTETTVGDIPKGPENLHQVPQQPTNKSEQFSSQSQPKENDSTILNYLCVKEEPDDKSKTLASALVETQPNQLNDISLPPDIKLAEVIEFIRVMKSVDCSADDIASLLHLARELKQNDVTVRDVANMKNFSKTS